MGHRRRAWLLGLVLIAFVAVPAGAQQPTASPLPLQTALQQALDKNPDVAAARLARTAAAAGVAVASERLTPEISYEIEKETPKQSLTGVIPIELGQKRQYRIDLAKAAAATGEAAYNQVLALVRAEVRKTYFESAAADRRLALALDLRDLAVRVRDAARARFQAGDVPEMEVVQTELALSSVENEVTAARGEIAATRAELNALIGLAPTTQWTLSDDLLAGDVPPPETAIAQAMKGNADLAVLDRKLIEQRYRRAVANALRTPDLAVGPALTWDAEPEFKVGWRVSFAVTLPVFATHKAGVIAEDAELARLQAERDAMAARVTGAVHAALARASAAREQLQRYQSETLPRVESLERMAQTSYTSGQTGLVALLQALQQARETRQRGLQAAVDFQSALAELERAIGAIR